MKSSPKPLNIYVQTKRKGYKRPARSLGQVVVLPKKKIVIELPRTPKPITLITNHGQKITVTTLKEKATLRSPRAKNSPIAQFGFEGDSESATPAPKP